MAEEIWHWILKNKNLNKIKNITQTDSYSTNNTCMHKFHLLNTKDSGPRLVMFVKQHRDPCSGLPMDWTNYWKCVSHVPIQPDWQIDNGLFNRPVMVHTQILIHRWGPRKRFNKKKFSSVFWVQAYSMCCRNIDRCMTNLNHPFKLEKLKVQLLKIVFEDVSQPVIIHDLHQQCKGLLLWKLNTIR